MIDMSNETALIGPHSFGARSLETLSDFELRDAEFGRQWAVVGGPLIATVVDRYAETAAVESLSDTQIARRVAAQFEISADEVSRCIDAWMAWSTRCAVPEPDDGPDVIAGPAVVEGNGWRLRIMPRGHLTIGLLVEQPDGSTATTGIGADEYSLSVVLKVSDLVTPGGLVTSGTDVTSPPCISVDYDHVRAFRHVVPVRTEEAMNHFADALAAVVNQGLMLAGSAREPTTITVGVTDAKQRIRQLIVRAHRENLRIILTIHGTPTAN